jgi:hypothetical protein
MADVDALMAFFLLQIFNRPAMSGLALTNG